MIQCITTNWGGEPTVSMIRRLTDGLPKFFRCLLQFENATEMGIVLDDFMKIQTTIFEGHGRIHYNYHWGRFWYFECQFDAKEKDIKKFAKKYGIHLWDGI